MQYTVLKMSQAQKLEPRDVKNLTAICANAVAGTLSVAQLKVLCVWMAQWGGILARRITNDWIFNAIETINNTKYDPIKEKGCISATYSTVIDKSAGCYHCFFVFVFCGVTHVTNIMRNIVKKQKKNKKQKQVVTD